MTNQRWQIRSEGPEDLSSVEQVNLAAFARPMEASLVQMLRQEGMLQVSLVAELDERIVGTVMFHEATLTGSAGTVTAVILSPLAVTPEWQQIGIGADLTRHGLAQCRNLGVAVAMVLGHPTYYPRFGFSAEMARQISGPWRGDAFMAMELKANALASGPFQLTSMPQSFARVEEHSSWGK